MEGHMYASRPLILKKWSPKIVLTKPELASIPIWIKLQGLPLQYWNQDGISKIGSAIGNPLYMDAKTAEATSLNFARLCVEIEAGDPLPSSIEIHSPFGVEMLEVEYEWKPLSCKDCKTFSHSADKCPKKSQSEQKSLIEWRPVQKKSTPIDSEPQLSIIAALVEPSLPEPELPHPSSQPALPIPVSKSPPLSTIQTFNPFSSLDSDNLSEPYPEGNQIEFTDEDSEPELPKAFANLKKLWSPGLADACKIPVKPNSSPANAPGSAKFPPPKIPHLFAPYKLISPKFKKCLTLVVLPPSIQPLLPMIKFGIWNIRGLGTSNKRKEVRNLIQKNNLPLISILETHVSQINMQRYIDEICGTWNSYGNYLSSDRGRIWLLWNPQMIHLNILLESDQFLHCEVRYLQTQINFNLTCIYARNKVIDRRVLWNQLHSISLNIVLPWITTGDFNVTRFSDERIGGANPNAVEMDEFNNWVDSCYLFDLRSQGQSLSWNNRSKTGNLKLRRLDRAMVNSAWLENFPRSTNSYHHPGLSDHSPLIIQLDNNPHTIKIPFRFQSMWLEDSSVYEVVERAWQTKIEGTPLFCVTQKLREVKKALKTWNTDTFGRIDIQAPLLRQQLDAIQNQLALSPTDINLRNAKEEIKDSYIRVARKEEILYMQKSRVNWLTLGDSNTAFFHSAMMAHQNQNNIQGTSTPDGTFSTDPSIISNTMVDFFSNLLNSSENNQPTAKSIIPDPIRNLTTLQLDHLAKPFSKEEIWDTISSSDGNKAPGPDDFNGDFFKAFWYLVKDDITEAILSFFSKGKMLPQLNCTFIALIPKTPDAASPEKYRPIALCNFLYKTITKLMASRLKPIMDSLISPFQSAFIQGRSIQDNILLSHDLCHNFHRKTSTKAMCIKMDLKKAFDSVNHSSLISFLQKIGFPQMWCNWIHQCISTPSFSILINGSPQGFFKSSNGLRQGDPLSPLLFCFVMEMLTCLLQVYLCSGQISSPFSRKNFTISHLLFADDVMLFVDPTSSCAEGVINCLNLFKQCFGLEFNPGKSENFFSGISNGVKRAVCNILRMEEGHLPIKYLGLPLITSRLTASDCQPIIDKIRNRLSVWTNRNLSRSGRAELIRTVLSTYQIYWSVAFHIPAIVLDNIEKILRNFLWSGSNTEKKYHNIAWESLCKPKREGGLGIRRLPELNKAAQLKQLWHILDNKNVPWVKWFSLKYIRNRSIWTLPMPAKPSWAARSIINARNLASSLVCYIVCPNSKLNFWTDPWHPAGPISNQISFEPLLNLIPISASINRIFEEGWWNLIQTQPYLQELKKITDTALISSSQDTKVNWKPESNGHFSIRSAWNSIRSTGQKVPWVSSIWFPGHVPKFSTTAWLAIQNKLTTKDNLHFLGPARDRTCPLCTAEPESTNHLFFNCSYSAWIWRQILGRVSDRKKQKKSLNEEEAWIRGKFKLKGQSYTFIRLLFTASIHHLWLERNNRVHEGRNLHKHFTLKKNFRAAREKSLFLKLDDNPSEISRKISQLWKLPLFHKQLSLNICSWKPPQPGWIKLNTDASLANEEGSIGGLLRSSDGKSLSLFSLSYPAAPIHDLEIEAIHMGLNLAVRANYRCLWIESDSLLAVNVIQKSAPCPWTKLISLEKIDSMLSNLQAWSISHLWREGNRAADYLSKSNCPMKGFPISHSVFPDEFQNILLEDSSGAIYIRL
ncbi:uncharacterized protein LOC143878767 [Tasmannia lanceolata]|uniref:uncharacterized protein LOC143878767 n=1 Tax=Tasmannia lanceolata TaxID=3420 RepID=UPI004063A217